MFFDLQVGNLIEPITGRCWDSHETLRQVGARIDCYRREGVSPGDRVFVHYGNSLEFFADLLAVWHIGAAVVPIDSRLTAFETENLARTVRPRLSLVDASPDPIAAASLTAAGAKVIIRADLDPRDQAGSERIRFDSRALLDSEALILFTSGSTGIPKGVVHTHRSLRARWMALRQSLGVECYRRTLCLLPTHFGHGLICNSLFPWLSGQDLFIAPPFSIDSLMQLGQLIDSHRITFLSSVPSMWGLTLKASKPPKEHTLQRVHCGSAPLSALLWKQIQDWSGTNQVYNAYGITETGSWVAGTTLDDFTPENGLIGVPWGAVIRVLKSCERGAPFAREAMCRPEEAGYVWINTPALMQGYFGQPELTEQVVSGGWFLTGDIGLLDQRERLYLKGREREEINKGGAKIYPADIDAVVERFEHTKDVCTFAVEDSLYGQNVAIAVVLSKDDSATIQALHRWMKHHLAEFKIPTRWHIVDSLPRNSRGKVNRSVVHDSCIHRTPLDLPKILRART